MAYEIETDCWPLVIQLNPAEATLADLEKLFATVDGIYRRGEKIAWLGAFPPHLKIQPSINKRLAEQMAKTRQQQKQLSVAIGFYSQSKMFNFFLSARLLAWPIDCPYTSSSSFDELMRWVEEQMRESGLQPPRGLAERAREVVAKRISVS